MAPELPVHPELSPTESVVSLRQPAPQEAGHVADLPTFIRELRRSRHEVETARLLFDTVTDPLLIDHVVFRLGAAEKHFNYLFQVARKMGIWVDGVRWEWNEDD